MTISFKQNTNYFRLIGTEFVLVDQNGREITGANGASFEVKTTKQLITFQRAPEALEVRPGALKNSPFLKLGQEYYVYFDTKLHTSLELHPKGDPDFQHQTNGLFDGIGTMDILEMDTGSGTLKPVNREFHHLVYLHEECPLEISFLNDPANRVLLLRVPPYLDQYVRIK